MPALYSPLMQPNQLEWHQRPWLKSLSMYHSFLWSILNLCMTSVDSRYQASGRTHNKLLMMETYIYDFLSLGVVFFLFVLFCFVCFVLLLIQTIFSYWLLRRNRCSWDTGNDMAKIALLVEATEYNEQIRANLLVTYCFQSNIPISYPLSTLPLIYRHTPPIVRKTTSETNRQRDFTLLQFFFMQTSPPMALSGGNGSVKPSAEKWVL